MSSISGKAGDTGWLDRIDCDLCDAFVERKGTGRMEIVPLSITDPRIRERVGLDLLRAPTPPLPELEYEHREFDEGALVGWASYSRGPRDDDGAKMDLCPKCAQVFEDSLLERSKTGLFGTDTEKDFGKEVPARVWAGMTTNFRQAGEAGRAIGLQMSATLMRSDDVYSAAVESIGGRSEARFIVPSAQPIPSLRIPRIRDTDGGPCLQCGNAPVMAGEVYCYECMARSPR